MNVKHVEVYNGDDNTLYEHYDVQLTRNEMLHIKNSLKYYLINNKKMNYNTIQSIVKMVDAIEGEQK